MSDELRSEEDSYEYLDRTYNKCYDDGTLLSLSAHIDTLDDLLWPSLRSYLVSRALRLEDEIEALKKSLAEVLAIKNEEK